MDARKDRRDGKTVAGEEVSFLDVYLPKNIKFNFLDLLHFYNVNVLLKNNEEGFLKRPEELKPSRFAFIIDIKESLVNKLQNLMPKEVRRFTSYTLFIFIYILLEVFFSVRQAKRLLGSHNLINCWLVGPLVHWSVHQSVIIYPPYAPIRTFVYSSFNL